VRLIEGAFFAIAVLLACVGWGRAVERGLHRWGSEEPLPRLSTGVVACVGLAASLCAAGVFVAIDQYHEWIGWLWIGGGLILAAAGFSPDWQTSRIPPGRLALAAAAIGVIGLEAVFLTGRALENPPWNLCDDFPAYIPLVDRLVDTGGMIEPFSLRRVTGFGGVTVLESLFTSGLGTAGIYVSDIALGGLLVGLLLMPLRPTLSRFLLGALLVASFVLWQSLQRNLSPSYLIVALFAAALLIPFETRRTRDDLLDDRVLFLVGLLGAGLLTMRFAPALPVAAFGAALVLRASGGGLVDRLRGLGVFGAAMGVAVTGWMIALWRASGTPMYPPFAGNVHPETLVFMNPEADLSQLWAKFLDVLSTAEFGLMLVAVLLAGVVLVVIRRRTVWAEAPLLAVPGLVIALAMMLESLSRFRSFDLARTGWPLVAAVLVAALVLLANEATTLRRLNGAVAAVVVVAVAGAMLRSTSWVGEKARADAEAAVDVLKGDGDPFEPWRGTESDYAGAQAAAPAGAKIATTSDYPQNFDYARNDVINLDILGAVSPDPGMPLGGTTREMTSYLREQGIDYVVLTDPNGSACLWNYGIWKGLVAGGAIDVRWGRYILQWLDWAKARATEDPELVTRHGSLFTLDLRSAPTRAQRGD
jgi:hypothetical protein